ncbi:hypothetical protein [Parendozoicomonas sp. Alg238-R29]|uniref:hypothetical protein n=1 Tax=Parendozoicomonas sp. Alg238-R29 TaxID=2993446 RepID=UPI00248F260F|nr:hypothetical protein [Parendozoicomonas sp. Alg238-R29]
MYPTTGTALLYAFNSSLFDDTTSASWQQQIEDKYPEEAACVGMATVAKAVGYDNGRLRKKDWHTQAGMVSALLMKELSPSEYWLIRVFYTFDDEVAALIRAWQYIQPALVGCDGIRKSIRENKTALQYLVLRAIKPKLLQAMPTMDGELSQKSISNRQSEVKRVVLDWKESVYKTAEAILMLNGLVWEDE